MSSHADGKGRLWGLLAEYETVPAVLEAAARVRDAGYRHFDVHTPIPIHGLDEAMGIRVSRLPWLVAGCGAAGASAGLLLQWWTNAVDYPFIISAKPYFGLPAAIPVTFELTVLLAAIGAFVGMLVANGLPQFFHPLFRVERFRRASNDRFFISIEARDPRFDPRTTRTLLESSGGKPVLEVEG
ncbi:MAG: DUF3341 domain-containing protein [Acidobacteriota bacterium]|jgi:hypothetical protein